jgi:excisionase family DNA binding protein
MEAAEAKVHRVSQVSKVLGIGETSVREIIAAGELRAVRLCGRLAVTEEALREYIAGLPDAR